MKSVDIRSSRLNKQWRVIYTIDRDQLIVYVVKINPKDFIVSPDPTTMDPGEMLATLRQLQGLTQAALAKKARMT